MDMDRVMDWYGLGKGDRVLSGGLGVLWRVGFGFEVGFESLDLDLDLRI